MIRPTFEVADILRVQGDRFLDRYRSSFGFQQLKAFRAILRCRTAALGGHRDACPSCGHQAISYNSCRNRHCPKCQTQARERWLQARERELLATTYFHIVFTVPHELNVLALENPRLFYDLLFTASAQTLLEIAIDRKHLGAEIGVISILHTWGQNLLLHPPHSLRHSCRWTLARSTLLDPPTLSFLLIGEGPQPRLSRQVPRRPETSAQPQQAMLQRPRRRSGRPTAVCKTPAPPAPPRLGRLCQARLRWSHAGVTLSRPLHPSRGHFQSSLVGLRPRARHLSLEGLRPRWQARQDDSWRHRVLTALLSARTSQRVRAHPSLRVPRESLSRFPPGTIPTTVIQQLHSAC